MKVVSYFRLAMSHWDDPPWARGLKRYGNYYEGIVQDAELIFEAHKQHTVATVRPRSAPAVGKENIKVQNKDPDKVKVITVVTCMYPYYSYDVMHIFQEQPDAKIYWKQTVGDTVIEFDGVPFCLIKTQTYDCQHQRERTTKRLCIQGTKKMGCPAHIIVKEYHLYPEYKITETEWKALKVHKL